MPDATLLLSFLGLVMGMIAVLWKHIDKRFDEMERKRADDQQKVSEIRTEMFREFVRRSDFEKIDGTLDLIFERINKVSADLNQLIGQHKKPKRSMLD